MLGPLRSAQHTEWQMRLRCSLALLVLALSSIGCVGRAVNEGVGLATGPKGLFMQIEPVERSLDEYVAIELERLQDDTGGRIPEEFWEELGKAFGDELEARGLPAQGRTAPHLRVRGWIMHVETNSLTGLVLGDFEEVIMRAELVDAQTGDVLGRANLIGRSDDSVNRGIRKKAQGAARALAAWIDAYYEANGDGTIRESLEAKEIGKRDDGRRP
mgnify:CR=1 FL=1